MKVHGLFFMNDSLGVFIILALRKVYSDDIPFNF